MNRLQITYRPNEDYSEGVRGIPRLYASIDLTRFGVEEKILKLPIYYRKLDQPVGSLLEAYSTSVAGLYLEKGNLGSLEKTLDLYMSALIHFGRLPEYAFKVGNKAWPIYRLPDQLVTRYPGNPVLGGSTIGELRVALADYFKLSGLIRNRKELEILILSRHDLQLYPPVCAFRGEKIADIPAFPIVNGRVTALSAPVNTASVDVSFHDSLGILDLYDAVGEYLMQRRKLDRPTDLTVRKLSSQTWQSLQTVIEPYDRALAYYDDNDGRLVRRVIPVFANGKHLVASRTNRLTRTALYLAPDIWQLQDQFGQELYSRGKLSSPDYVTVTQAEELPISL
ncbi:MAG: hypothetical protein PVH03_14145 [Chloroflexota bacterium]|jgi:hypothetical protein